MGDSWAVNAAVAQKVLGKRLATTVDGLIGEVRLTKLTKIDNAVCLELSTQMGFKATPVLVGLPSWDFRFEESPCTMTSSTWVPTDLSTSVLPVAQNTLAVTMAFRIIPKPGHDDKEMTGHCTFTMTCKKTAEMSPVK